MHPRPQQALLDEQLGIFPNQVREASKVFSYRSNDLYRTKLEECRAKLKVAIKSAQAKLLRSKCNLFNNSNGKTFWNQLTKPSSNTYVGNLKKTLLVPH